MSHSRLHIPCAMPFDRKRRSRLVSRVDATIEPNAYEATVSRGPSCTP